MGKLNILHHKSYHVYNRDNVERVRRDEANAELEALGKTQRVLAAESESRITQLRDRAREEKKKDERKREKKGEKELEKQLRGGGKGKERQVDSSAPLLLEHRTSQDVALANSQRQNFSSTLATTPSASSTPISTSNGHVNFWADQESGKVTNQPLAQNSSYVRDKKRKEDEWNDQLTMYLDKPAKELKPWYNDKELKSGQERKQSQEQQLEKAYNDGETKRRSDPLAMINGYLRQRHQAHWYVPKPGFKPPSPSSFQPPSTLPTTTRRRQRKASRSPSPNQPTTTVTPPPFKRRRESSPPTTTTSQPQGLVGRHLIRPSSTSSLPQQPRSLEIDINAERERARALIAAHERKSNQFSNLPNLAR